MKLAIASDHAGLVLKREVLDALQKLGHQVEDLGAHDVTSVDYPDFAALVSRKVRDGLVDLGVLCCGTGIGMSMAANKFRGVRAAVCTSEFEARMTRLHNDANVLCLGERVIGPGQARAIAEVFVRTAFEGGRHQNRVKKIALAEDENRRS